MKITACFVAASLSAGGLLGMYAASQGAAASRSSLSETIFVLLFAGSGVVALVGGLLLADFLKEE